MSPIRALERGDLGAVADLYEEVFRTQLPRKPGLADEFARTVLDHPWADPEIPSLVYEGEDGAIAGFIGSHVRRLRFGSRPVRAACSGQLITDPAYGRRGIGALLLREYMAGPQDLTFTDGGTDAVRVIWEGLGGCVSALPSSRWTRVFRPVTALEDRFRRHPRGRSIPGAARSARRADEVAARRLRPGPVSTVAEPLDVPGLMEAVSELSRGGSARGRRAAGTHELSPDYDEDFLVWLFREAGAVKARGDLVRRLVRDRSGALMGWYVFYNWAGGVSQTLQVGARPACAGAVLDHLFRDAAQRGSAAIQGRVEPMLLPALRIRRCLLAAGEWALLASEDTELLNAIAYGRALLTRLDGEWWMGHHLADHGPP